MAPDPEADDASPSNNDLHYLLWEGGTASKHADSFPGAVEGICELMDPVRIGVSRDPRLRQGVRAVHFMSNTKADDRVVTLVYDQVRYHTIANPQVGQHNAVAATESRIEATWAATQPRIQTHTFCACQRAAAALCKICRSRDPRPSTLSSEL